MMVHPQMLYMAEEVNGSFCQKPLTFTSKYYLRCVALKWNVKRLESSYDRKESKGYIGFLV